MAKLTKQLMIKISPEMETGIDKALSSFLKKTGEPITKAEFIRRILDAEIKNHKTSK